MDHTKVYFISESFAKNNNYINENISWETISKEIPKMALLKIKPFLGGCFFDELLEKYNDRTLNDDERKLVDNYIRPALMSFVLYRINYNLSFNLTNKGLQSQFGDNSDSNDLATVSYIAGLDFDDANIYLSEMEKYLKKNYILFPTLSENSTDCGFDLCKTTVKKSSYGIRFI